MPRGGYRGGGRPPLFKQQPTRTIRVPVVFADQLTQIAQRLDSGESITPQIPVKNMARARDLLTQALDLKANAGGAIKAKIREALTLLDE